MTMIEDSGNTGTFPARDHRTAARFPLNLPIVILAGEEQYEATTINMSSGGILLRIPQPCEIPNGLEFLLEVPKEATDDGSTAAIHCSAHVIRSYDQDGFCYVAAVIDEYRFQ